LFFIVLIHWSQSCFAATNEPMNFTTQTAQGQVASRNVTAGQNLLFRSFHS